MENVKMDRAEPYRPTMREKINYWLRWLRYFFIENVLKGAFQTVGFVIVLLISKYLGVL